VARMLPTGGGREVATTRIEGTDIITVR
jgi:hypothetical protein